MGKKWQKKNKKKKGKKKLPKNSKKDVNKKINFILKKSELKEESLLKQKFEQQIHTGKLWYIVNFLLFVIAITILLGVAFVAGIFLIFGKDLPDVRSLKTAQFAETSVIYDRNGHELYKIYGDENRVNVPLNQINQKMIDATISVEDKNFYTHHGFDLQGIIRAQLNNWRDDSPIQGASTITQQLAKNLYLSSKKTFTRKIKELILAMEIEWYYTKDDILDMYLNKISYGSNAYGIEAAANTFFGKSSKNLTLVEAAILASLPNAPSEYSPYGNNIKALMGYCITDYCNSPEDNNYIWGRKDIVLERMMEDGKISQAAFDQAWHEGFNVKFKKVKNTIRAPHFVMYIRNYLDNKYGKKFVESGGLAVYTTLDSNLQNEAQKIISDKYQSNVKAYGADNAALVALNPQNGQVLAMVGSANYWDNEIDGQVNMVTSLRQPGSAFKPLVYAAAIENAGIGSGTILGDYRTKFGNNYIPVDADNHYQGKMNVRRALASSRNIPAIKAWYLAGGEKTVLNFIDKMGVASLQQFKNNYNANPDRHWDFSYGPAMAIGSGEMKLIELADAFAVFADNGKYNPINPILKIKDRNGDVIEKFKNRSIEVMHPETAFIINNILSDVRARPAGSWRNVLTITGQNLAAKTGTSNKLIGKTRYPNNLVTLGYTPSILAATWVGNTDGKQVSLRAWGEFTAAPINKAFLEYALKNKPLIPYSVPKNIIKIHHEYYPPNWNKKRNYDSQFKPLDKKICTVTEKNKDPNLCYTDAELSKMGMNGAEIPLNTGNNKSVIFTKSKNNISPVQIKFQKNSISSTINAIHVRGN